jgi:hypothetical protein
MSLLKLFVPLLLAALSASGVGAKQSKTCAAADKSTFCNVVARWGSKVRWYAAE